MFYIWGGCISIFLMLALILRAFLLKLIISVKFHFESKCLRSSVFMVLFESQNDWKFRYTIINSTFHAASTPFWGFVHYLSDWFKLLSSSECRTQRYGPKFSASLYARNTINIRSVSHGSESISKIATEMKICKICYLYSSMYRYSQILIKWVSLLSLHLLSRKINL